MLRPGIRTTVLAASASALALWASAPPLSVGGLAWVAIVPAAAVFICSPEKRFARASVPLAYTLYLELLLVPALPVGLTDDQWGETPIPVLVGGSPVLPVALIAGPLFGLALWAVRFPQVWLPASTLARLSPTLFGLLCIAVPAIAWTALDLLRTKLDPGGLWGPLFISQAGGPAARLGALGGPWLITFAIVVVNYALAIVLVERRRGLTAAVPAAALVAALLVAAPGSPGGGRGAAESITAAAVQPGYDTADFDRPVLRYFRPGTYDLAALDMIRDLGRLTRVAARRGAQLVVWPEAALWVDPRRVSRVRAPLARLARSSGTTIIVPYFLRERAEGATVVVSAGTDRRAARFTRPQPKQRPMWFWGESGDNKVPPWPVETEPGAVGTMLGVDNQEPGPTRLLAARGADLVTSSTHDWKQLARVQKELARMHAAETHTPLVRADWRYGSVLLDAGGRELATAGNEQRRTVIVARVTPRRGSTPFTTLGDALGWMAVAVTAGLVLAATAQRYLAFKKSRASRARAASPPRRRPVPSSPS